MTTETIAADSEITLRAGNLRLKVAPLGAALRGLWRENGDGKTQEIVTGYTGAQNKIGGQGDVLIPFPGRVRAGKYTFEGETHQMAITDREVPNAIHGFLRQVVWEITEQSESALTFAVSMRADANPGYPFALRATVSYLLNARDGMTCRFTVENTGKRTAPVAAGFHPYFTVGSDRIDGDILHVPMAATLEFENLIPTGSVLPVDGTPFDFRAPRVIGSTKFNTCYLQPLRDADGLLRLRLAAPDDSRAVTVWMDAAFNYVVLYSGDPLPDAHRRRSLAIEPMTCGSDAFNHPEWGLAALAPGQTLTGAWGVSAA